jgi:uncharacterized protein YcbK (DUF882 family)
MKRKQLHQVKTQWYYVFWAIATVAVVSGQIYVGSGYRSMADQFEAYVTKISSN